MSKSSIGSKTFLLGEYLALSGGSSVVLVHRPFFTLGESGNLIDPYERAGGFGGSTAEFIFKIRTKEPNLSIDEMLARYLNDPSHKGTKPSGFDLVAQLYGKSCVITNITKLKIEEFNHSKTPLLLFQASHLPNRKTKTFEHLPTVIVDPRWAMTARQIVESFLIAHAAGDWDVSGSLLNAYSDHLATQHWVENQVQKDRETLLRIPGVLGVKGAGALQTDAMIVIYDPLKNGSKDLIIQEARSLGLRHLLL